MTTAAVTPFVSTRYGVAVVEVDSGDKLYVRLESGWRFWIRTEKCERDVSRPYWYSEPDPRTIPGYVR
jgi:hypothetical protein